VIFQTNSLTDLLCGGGYLGIILLCGFALLCILLRPGQRHWLELLGLSFAAGCAVVTQLLFVVSLAGATPNRATLICIAVLSCLLLIWTARRKGTPSPTVPTPRHRLDALSILGLVAAGLVIVALFRGASNAGAPVLDEVDAFAIWLLKAKWIAFKPLLPMPAEFHNPTLSYTHQDYPLGFPILVAGLYAMVGRVDDHLVQVLLIPINLALVAMIYSAIRRHHRRAMAVIITALFAAAPAMTKNAGSPVPESMLILLYTGALSMLLRWMETGNRGDLLLAGMLAAATAFVKNEGLALLPLLAIAALLWSIFKRRKLQTPVLRYSEEPGRTSRPLNDFLLASLVTLITLTPWLIYRLHLPRTHEDYGGKLLNPQIIARNLPRLTYVLPAFTGWIFNAPRVGVLWYLLAIAAVLTPTAFKRGSVLLLWLILLIQLSLYVLTFIVTPWPLKELLPLITARLLMQASPPAALLIGLHLQNLNWPPAQKSTTTKRT
jgi:hypothetical protein